MLTTQVISVPLSSFLNFVVLGGSTVTFDGTTTYLHSGNVGTFPGTSITGSKVLEKGSVESATVFAGLAAKDRATVYNLLSALMCMQVSASGDMSGLTLATGVYCSASGTLSTVAYGVVTLDGRSDATSQWVFQAASTVITGGYSSMVLINGGLASNVYWRVGSSATIGLSSTFVGTILAYASVTFGHDSVMIGRALAGAAVTFESGSSLTLSTSYSSSSSTLSSVDAGVPTSAPTSPPRAIMRVQQVITLYSL